MPKWEYKITQHHFMFNPPFDPQKPKNTEAITIMKKMGGNGWELVQANSSQTGITNFFWKRELKGPVDEWTT